MRTIITCLLAVCVIPASIMAQERPDRPARQGGRMPERRLGPTERIMRGGDVEQSMLLRALDNPVLAQRLQLSEEQKEEIGAEFKKLDAELEVLQPKLDEALKVQTGFLDETDLDSEKVMAAVEDAWKLRTEIAKIQTRKLLALRSRMTEEQVNRAREMMNERMQMYRQRRAPGMADGERGRRGNRGEAGAARPRRGEGPRGRQQQRESQKAPFTPQVEP